MLYQNFMLSCLIIDLVCISYVNYAICSEYCTIHKMVAEGYDMKQEPAMFLSPAEDESSREVFGLIKKLNIVPDSKKKAKTPCMVFSILILYFTHQRKRSMVFSILIVYFTHQRKRKALHYISATSLVCLFCYAYHLIVNCYFYFYAALFKMPPVGGKSNIPSKVNQFALGISNVDCSIV